MNGYCGSSTNTCYKFQLIIDGCNGPIRFREDRLRRAAVTAAMVEGSTGKSDGSGAEQISSRNHNHGDDDDDDDETILSLLRPESIVVSKQKEQLRNSDRSKKNAKGRRKKIHRPKTWTAEDGTCVEESSNRLDMIPLLEKLLMSSTRNDRDITPDGRQLFDSISVVFDGISITKRPPVPASNQQQSQQQQAIEEEIARGRLWHITSDATNAATAVITSEATLCEGLCEGLCEDLHNKSGCLTIEVTGLYDEADNVIVERIKEHHRRKIDHESLKYQMSCCSDQAIDATGEGGGPMAAATRIQIFRRTERGAGKNRRLFQPLGLLRPESVACVFEFGAPIVSTMSNYYKEGQEEFQSSGHSDGHRQSTLDSSSFRRLALDGDQTLRSVRRQNPGNVFLTLNESQEVPHATGSEKGAPVILPIVATDDIFLRQRIVHEGGYVMTFHQLWLLLIDAV